MTITANGKPKTVPEGASLEAVLKTFGLTPERVVVEYNGAALRRDRFPFTVLCDGDRLEIAQMVGGG